MHKHGTTIEQPATTGCKIVCRRLLLSTIPAILLISHVGCFSPRHSRLPTGRINDPRAESRAYQEQDPFPDPDIGPDTMARPRDFARPRTAPRRAAELRLLHGIPSGPEHVRPGDPRGGLHRPNAAY